MITIPEAMVPLANLGHAVDLMGTFVASITGATSAIRKELDVVGIVVLAFVAGTAGGITRDLLIGAVPPAAFGSLKYLLLAMTASAIAFWWYPKISND